MGLIKRIFGKSEEQGGGIDWFVRFVEKSVGDKTFKDFSTEDLLDLYNKNALIKRCAWEIATSAAEPPLNVMRWTPEGELEPAPEHWANELIERPNDLYDRAQFVIYMSLHKLLSGASFVLPFGPEQGVRGAGPIVELWPVPSHWMKVVPGKGLEPIAGYQIQQDYGHWVDLEPDEVIYSYYPDPTSTWKASGPLRSASADVQLDQRRQNYVGEMMKNLVVPGLGIFSKQPMSAEAKDGLRKSIQERAGAGNRGGTIFLEGEGTDAKMFNPLADVDLPGLISMTESRICMVFGVPPEQIGSRTGLSASTYSNKEEARKSFYAETMKPFWAGLESSLTKGILYRNNDVDHVFRFDLGDISALQPDMKSISERVTAEYQLGLITREEARRELGRDADIPEDETLFRDRYDDFRQGGKPNEDPAL